MTSKEKKKRGSDKHRTGTVSLHTQKSSIQLAFILFYCQKNININSFAVALQTPQYLEGDPQWYK